MRLNFGYSEITGKAYCQRNSGKKIELETLNHWIAWYVTIWIIRELWIAIIKKRYEELQITWDGEEITREQLTEKIHNAQIHRIAGAVGKSV